MTTHLPVTQNMDSMRRTRHRHINPVRQVADLECTQRSQALVNRCGEHHQLPLLASRISPLTLGLALVVGLHVTVVVAAGGWPNAVQLQRHLDRDLALRPARPLDGHSLQYMQAHCLTNQYSTGMLHMCAAMHGPSVNMRSWCIHDSI